ncbi:sugar transferase [Duganella caerulea]|uniref:glycosyltransferase family 4 protein n=1 Tax=Duganella caerulea TaxID=2885762 RepID=UPI0030EADACF
MKIEVVSFTGDSGLADYAVSLARALVRSAQTSLVTAASLPARFDELGFTVRRVFRRSRHYPLDMLRFGVGVLRRRPDWLVLQGPLKVALLDGVLMRLLRLGGVRCAVTVHDVLPHYPRPWSRAEFGFYYRSFQRVIVHSAAALEGVRKLGVTGEVLVVPHGIYDIFNLSGVSRSAARAKVGALGDDDFVVLFFGNLETRKGLLPFLEAARLLAGERRVRMVLAGSNSVSGKDAQRLDAARNEPNVLVHDRRIPFEDVENYFAACDLVALPYLEGTTSGVLKLALAFGKPVVATRVGDFPEQVPAGAGVFLENDAHLPAALAEAVLRMAADYPAYAGAMAAAGQHAQWPDIAGNVMTYLKS